MRQTGFHFVAGMLLGQNFETNAKFLRFFQI
jgi:hypothetical protein